MSETSALWRRLDGPGHDACVLKRAGDGWELDGCAVFRHEGGPAQLRYRVACDRAWRSRSGLVEGWIGVRAVRVEIAREGSGWSLNGRGQAAVDGCTDLDFGFTPATNLLQLRRLGLADGQGGDAPAAWFDAGEDRLIRLDQRYERRGPGRYWYESSTGGYAGLLEVSGDGWARRYPGLWEMEG